MIRKWSYINFLKLTPNDITLYNNYACIHNKINNLKLFKNFKLKVFRKNTRFKNFVTGPTKLNRRYISVVKRRFNLKNYLIVSSFWVKPFLKYKHVVNFIQNYYTFSVAGVIPYTKIFSKEKLKDIYGIGLFGINYAPFNKHITTKLLTNKKNYTDLSKRSIEKKIYPSVFFRSYTDIHKLNNLGFLLQTIKYDNFFYVITSKYIKTIHQKNTNKLTINPYIPTLLHLITTLHINLRRSLILKTLYTLKNYKTNVI